MGALDGKVALVAGATRGAGRGIALELGAAGAHVYVTGRTTRQQRSEYDRPETIEETAELIEAEGGTATAIGADHLDVAQVRGMVDRIDREHGRLDVWKTDLERGLRVDGEMQHARQRHLGRRKGASSGKCRCTSSRAMPHCRRSPAAPVDWSSRSPTARSSTTPPTTGSPRSTTSRSGRLRLGWSQGHELASHGCTALTITPGWLRSELMLEHFATTEETWHEVPGHFGISETPRFMGRAVAALAADPDVGRWNQASVSSGQLAREYGFTDVDGSAPDAWRYIVEVQDAGKNPEPENYR